MFAVSITLIGSLLLSGCGSRQAAPKPGPPEDWTGVSYQERMSSSQAPLLYVFSILVIFLCVAALYESWPIPIANMLMLSGWRMARG